MYNVPQAPQVILCVQCNMSVTLYHYMSKYHWAHLNATSATVMATTIVITRPTVSL